MKKYIVTVLFLLSSITLSAQRNSSSVFTSKDITAIEELLLKEDLGLQKKQLLKSLIRFKELNGISKLDKINFNNNELKPLTITYKSQEWHEDNDDYDYKTYRIDIRYSDDRSSIFYTKQQQNGASWKNILRYSETYNFDNLKLSHEEEKWISNKWLKINRRLYEYDENKNRIGEYFQTPRNNNYITFERTRNEYNSSGGLTYSLKEKGDTTNIDVLNEVTNWKPVNEIIREYRGDSSLAKINTTTWEEYGLIAKNEEIYNTAEQIESMTIYFYSETTSAIQILFTYYLDGNLESTLSRELHNSEWFNYNLFKREYDARGNEIMLLIQDWNNGEWENSHRYIAEYNGKNKLTNEVDEYWIAGNWEAKKRELYLYDTNGRRVEYKFQWFVNSTWANSFRYIYEYDNNGYQTKSVSETWKNESWTPDLRSIKVFNSAGSIIFAKSEIWINGWMPRDDHYSLPFQDSEFEMSFGYYELNAIYAEKDDIRLVIPHNYFLYQNYPNPFNPITKIYFSIPTEESVEINVYNAIGQKVHTLKNEIMQKGTYRIDFNGQSLSSGVYFYSIQTANFFDVKKMVFIK